MLIGMMRGRIIRVFVRVGLVTFRSMSMMSGFFVVTGLMLFGSMLMLFPGLFVMLGSLLVGVGGFL
jgi:hypothetical protein